MTENGSGPGVTVSVHLLQEEADLFQLQEYQVLYDENYYPHLCHL